MALDPSKNSNLEQLALKGLRYSANEVIAEFDNAMQYMANHG